jgi:hypothetical protein
LPLLFFNICVHALKLANVYQEIQQIFRRSYPGPPFQRGRELGRQKESRIRRNEMGRKDEGEGRRGRERREDS